VRNLIAAVLVATVAAVGGYLYWAWYHPLDPGADTFVIETGSSLRDIARHLAARGVLPEPHSFVWLAHLTGHSRDLKAGEYRFKKGLTSSELLDQVVNGRVVEYPLILLEGWNFRQALGAIRGTPHLKQTLVDLPPEQIMARLGHPESHPEGRFFPDTYFYSRGQSDVMILARAYDKMARLLEKEWANRTRNVHVSTPYEALILASIVEKETGRADERPLIAGVFLNRLRLGMRLQSDPTVIYGMGDAYNGNLRLVDLRRDNPYNTYTRRGLPPTPIAMPSAAALAAVLHPIETRALYFVSRGDGSHQFSETLQEHNDAVIKYQLGGKRRPFSSNSKPDVGLPRPSESGAQR
jgi:UPF0755 protein